MIYGLELTHEFRSHSRRQFDRSLSTNPRIFDQVAGSDHGSDLNQDRKLKTCAPCAECTRAQPQEHNIHSRVECTVPSANVSSLRRTHYGARRCPDQASTFTSQHASDHTLHRFSSGVHQHVSCRTAVRNDRLRMEYTQYTLHMAVTDACGAFPSPHKVYDRCPMSGLRRALNGSAQLD